MSLERLRQLSNQLRAVPEPKPTISSLFLVIAFSHGNFRVWTRQYGLAPTQLVYVDDTRSIDGYYDYTLVVLPGSRIRRETLDRLYHNAKEVIDTKQFYPVSQAGRIVRWEKFKKP